MELATAFQALGTPCRDNRAFNRVYRELQKLGGELRVRGTTPSEDEQEEVVQVVALKLFRSTGRQHKQPTTDEQARGYLYRSMQNAWIDLRRKRGLVLEMDTAGNVEAEPAPDEPSPEPEAPEPREAAHAAYESLAVFARSWLSKKAIVGVEQAVAIARAYHLDGVTTLEAAAARSEQYLPEGVRLVACTHHAAQKKLSRARWYLLRVVATLTETDPFPVETPETPATWSASMRRRIKVLLGVRESRT